MAGNNVQNTTLQTIPSADALVKLGEYKPGKDDTQLKFFLERQKDVQLKVSTDSQFENFIVVNSYFDNNAPFYAIIDTENPEVALVDSIYNADDQADPFQTADLGPIANETTFTQNITNPALENPNELLTASKEQIIAEANDDGNQEYLDRWNELNDVTDGHNYDASIFAGELKEDDLVQNESFQHAARVLYDEKHGEGAWEAHIEEKFETEWKEDLKNQATSQEELLELKGKLEAEEAAKQGLDFMGAFNYNMGSAAVTAFQMNGRSEEAQLATIYMMNAYEHKDMSWSGAGRAVTNMAQDVTFWGSLVFGFGVGAIAKQGAQKGALKLAADKLTDTVVNNAVGRAVQNRVTQITSSRLAQGAANSSLGQLTGRIATNQSFKVGMATGTFAGVEALADDYFIRYGTEKKALETVDLYYDTNLSEGLQYDFSRGASSFALGFGMGGALGTGGHLLGKQFRKGVDDALDARQATKEADANQTSKADKETDTPTTDKEEAKQTQPNEEAKGDAPPKAQKLNPDEIHEQYVANKKNIEETFTGVQKSQTDDINQMVDKFSDHIKTEYLNNQNYIDMIVKGTISEIGETLTEEQEQQVRNAVIKSLTDASDAQLIRKATVESDDAAAHLSEADATLKSMVEQVESINQEASKQLKDLQDSKNLVGKARDKMSGKAEKRAEIESKANNEITQVALDGSKTHAEHLDAFSTSVQEQANQYMQDAAENAQNIATRIVNEYKDQRIQTEAEINAQQQADLQAQRADIQNALLDVSFLEDSRSIADDVLGAPINMFSSNGESVTSGLNAQLTANLRKFSDDTLDAIEADPSLLNNRQAFRDEINSFVNIQTLSNEQKEQLTDVLRARVRDLSSQIRRGQNYEPQTHAYQAPPRHNNAPQQPQQHNTSGYSGQQNSTRQTANPSANTTTRTGTTSQPNLVPVMLDTDETINQFIINNNLEDWWSGLSDIHRAKYTDDAAAGKTFEAPVDANSTAAKRAEDFTTNGGEKTQNTAHTSADNALGPEVRSKSTFKFYEKDDHSLPEFENPIMPDDNPDWLSRRIAGFTHFDSEKWNQPDVAPLIPNDAHIMLKIRPLLRHVDAAVNDNGFTDKIVDMRSSINEALSHIKYTSDNKPIDSTVNKAQAEVRKILTEFREYAAEETEAGSGVRRIDDFLTRMNEAADQISQQRTYSRFGKMTTGDGDNGELTSGNAVGQNGFTPNQRESALLYVTDVAERVRNLTDPSYFDNLMTNQSDIETISRKLFHITDELQQTQARYNDTRPGRDEASLLKRYTGTGVNYYEQEPYTLLPNQMPTNSGSIGTHRTERQIIYGSYSPDDRILPLTKDMDENSEYEFFRNILNFYKKAGPPTKGATSYNFSTEDANEFANLLKRGLNMNRPELVFMVMQHLTRQFGPGQLRKWPEGSLAKLENDVRGDPYLHNLAKRISNIATMAGHDSMKYRMRHVLASYAETVEQRMIERQFVGATSPKDVNILNPLSYTNAVYNTFIDGRYAQPGINRIWKTLTNVNTYWKVPLNYMAGRDIDVDPDTGVVKLKWKLTLPQDEDNPQSWFKRNAPTQMVWNAVTLPAHPAYFMGKRIFNADVMNMDLRPVRNFSIYSIGGGAALSGLTELSGGQDSEYAAVRYTNRTLHDIGAGVYNAGIGAIDYTIVGGARLGLESLNYVHEAVGLDGTFGTGINWADYADMSNLPTDWMPYVEGDLDLYKDTYLFGYGDRVSEYDANLAFDQIFPSEPTTSGIREATIGYMVDNHEKDVTKAYGIVTGDPATIAAIERAKQNGGSTQDTSTPTDTSSLTDEQKAALAEQKRKQEEAARQAQEEQNRSNGTSAYNRLVVDTSPVGQGTWQSVKNIGGQAADGIGGLFDWNNSGHKPGWMGDLGNIFGNFADGVSDIGQKMLGDKYEFGKMGMFGLIFGALFLFANRSMGGGAFNWRTIGLGLLAVWGGKKAYQHSEGIEKMEIPTLFDDDKDNEGDDTQPEVKTPDKPLRVASTPGGDVCSADNDMDGKKELYVCGQGGSKIADLRVIGGTSFSQAEEKSFSEKGQLVRSVQLAARGIKSASDIEAPNIEVISDQDNVVILRPDLPGASTEDNIYLKLNDAG